MVSGSDSALLHALAAWFLFVALGKLKQLPDLSLSPPFSPFLSPFLLLVELLWYRGEQGRIREKGRDGMGKKEKGRATKTKKGRGAEVQEEISKAVLVLGAAARLPSRSHPAACEQCVMAQLCQHPGRAGLQASMALSGYHYPHSVALVTCRFFLLLWPKPQSLHTGASVLTSYLALGSS